MIKQILLVAGPAWQSAMQELAARDGIPPFTTHGAGEAVILLASQPDAYAALALEANAGGVWLSTLIDLTLGDTDQPVPLLILGEDDAGQHHRLKNAAHLHQPVDNTSLRQGLQRAFTATAKLRLGPVPPEFPDIDSIRIRYQPIIRLRDMNAVAVEVLARVLAGDGTLLGPESLIRAMTTSDRAIEFTRFVLQTTLNEYYQGHFPELKLNVAFNLPLDALLHPDVVKLFEMLRQTTDIPAKSLRFELTESQPVTDFPRTEAAINVMMAAGYGLSLDDVTPETPNLQRLLQMPFRAIKIDRSVVDGCLLPGTADKNRAFIRKLTTQAMKRRQSVIAEGIATLETCTVMQALGITHGQGYYFGRPLPARALKPWMTHWTATRAAKPD